MPNFRFNTVGKHKHFFSEFPLLWRKKNWIGNIHPKRYALNTNTYSMNKTLDLMNNASILYNNIPATVTVLQITWETRVTYFLIVHLFTYLVPSRLRGPYLDALMISV